jgi:hypothetical protein
MGVATQPTDLPPISSEQWVAPIHFLAGRLCLNLLGIEHLSFIFELLLVVVFWLSFFLGFFFFLAACTSICGFNRTCLMTNQTNAQLIIKLEERNKDKQKKGKN